MSLDSAIADATSYAGMLVESAKRVATAGPGSSPASLLGSSSLALARQQHINHHTEQYRHYTGWPYSIIRVIAQRIAGQPIRLARKTTSSPARATHGLQSKRLRLEKNLLLKRTLPGHLKSQAGDLEVVSEHPFLATLRNPNPLMTQWAHFFVTIASLELTGKSHWWTYIDESGRQQIWHLPSSWMEPIHDETKLYRQWEIRPDGFAAPWRVDGDQVILFGYPDPSNPLNHISPLQANARSVLNDESIQEANRRSFLNGPNFGTAIIVGRHPDAVTGKPGERPILTKAQQNQLIAAVKQRYRGVVNYDEPLILDGLIEDVKRISANPREMDFGNSSNLTKERMTQGWGVNPVSMGHLEGANRASSTTADAHLTSNCINPKIVLVSEILTLAVQRLYNDPGLVAYIEEAHAADPELELEAEKAMNAAGVMSDNEWRARHHLPPVKGGDSARVKADLVQVPITYEDDSDAGVPTQDAPDVGQNPPPQRSCRGLELGARGLRRLWLRQHSSLSAPLHSAAFKSLGDFAAQIAQNVQSAAARGEVTAQTLKTLPAETAASNLRDACAPHLLHLTRAGAVSEWLLFTPRNSTGELRHDLLPQMAAHISDQLPGEVNDSVKVFTERMLEQSWWLDLCNHLVLGCEGVILNSDRGDTLTEISKRVSELLSPAHIGSMARAVARTCATGCLNAGHDAVRRKLHQYGLVKAKRWLSEKDGGARPSHKAVSGTRVGVLENFLVGGEECCFPGEPHLSLSQRASCRCQCVSVSNLD